MRAGLSRNRSSAPLVLYGDRVEQGPRRRASLHHEIGYALVVLSSSTNVRSANFERHVWSQMVYGITYFSSQLWCHDARLVLRPYLLSGWMLTSVMSTCFGYLVSCD